MPEFLTYSKFYTNEDAEYFTGILKKAGIKFKIEHERDVLDKIYIGENSDPMFLVKIPEDRFEDANTILQKEIESQLKDVNPDYYLFGFTNQELIDVVKNKNEWNQFDQALGRKILSERNIEIPKDTEKKPSPVFQPVRLEMSWLITEYVLSIALGFLGIIIGLVTINAFRTLPDGKKVKMYDSFTVRHAKLILAIGIIRTSVLFLFKR